MHLHPLVLFVGIPALFFFTWPHVRDWFADQGFPIARGMKLVALVGAALMVAATFEMPLPLLSGPYGDYAFLVSLLGFFAYNALIRKGGALGLLGAIVQLLYGGFLGMGFFLVALLWVILTAWPRFRTWY